MDNKELYSFFNEYLRTATFPVAVKLSNDEHLPPKFKYAKDIYGYRIAICQGIAAARRLGRSMAFTAKDHACGLSHIYLGYKPETEEYKSGKFVHPLYVKDMAAASRTAAVEVHLDVNTFKNILIAPLNRAEFDPDIFIIYGNAAQIVRCVQGELFNEGGAIQSSFMGRCACGGYISYPFKCKKCNVVIPGGGERVFAMTSDDELAFAVPKERIQNLVEGIKGTHDTGVARIPTPFFGITADPAFPSCYEELDRYVGIKE